MTNRFDRLVEHFRERQLLVVVAIAQIVSLLGAIPGIVFLNLNLSLSKSSATTLIQVLPTLFIASYILLLVISWQITKTAQAHLDKRYKNSPHSEPEGELTAWKEITQFTSWYGISMIVVLLVVVVLPISFILQALEHNSTAPIFILFGGLAAAVGYTIVAALFVERFLRPSRLILLPHDFDMQLSGRSGALLGTKFQILTLGLIVIAVAIIAPLGYQQAARISASAISASEALRNLLSYSTILSLLMLALGAGFSYYAGHSISDPIKKMVEVVQKIEQGDLSQRIPVTATDEFADVAAHFNHMLVRLEELQNTLEKQITERTRQISASNELSRVASSILDPDELLTKVLNLLTERFDYYFAGIYFLDSSEKWVELKEATGDAGKILKQNHHRFETTSKNLVAVAIRERGPRIIHNIAEEKNRAPNPLLPATRSEIALPLMVGDHVIGALDVHSSKVSDFGLEVIEIMQNMAAQVTIALENARLFQETQQRIREMRVVQQQYLQEGWGRDLTIQREDLEYGIGEDILPDAQKLEVAVSLRDQTIGQIQIERDSEWTPEQQSLINAVAAQAAVALENARLVSESRQIALRERMLAEINSKIWSSTTIDGVLQTVAKELGRRFDASRTTIKLNVDDD